MEKTTDHGRCHQRSSQDYQSPEISLVEVSVEFGFAGSEPVSGKSPQVQNMTDWNGWEQI